MTSHPPFVKGFGDLAVQTDAVAVPRGMTAFAHGVRDVLGLRPREQVRRIDAARGIAAMQNFETLGNGTVREFVGETMRVIPWVARLASNLDVAVTRERVALHQPAGCRLDRACREAFSGCMLVRLPAGAEPYRLLSSTTLRIAFRLTRRLRIRIRQIYVTSTIRPTVFGQQFRPVDILRMCFRTHHANPSSVSSGTPVLSVIALANRALGVRAWRSIFE